MAESGTDLERGRVAGADQAWAKARRALSAADRIRPLGPRDLELLATSAYMEGHESEYLELLKRAHEGWLEAGDRLAAVRCAFWIGVNLAREGEMGRAGGWLARCRRLIEREPDGCVEHGYLLLPQVFELESKGEFGPAAEKAGEAAAIGERFVDSDLFALAAHTQGHILIRNGELGNGLSLLDEAMVELDRGGLSPIVSGIVYCGVILACQEAHEVRRAAEWTSALSNWCEQQPEMVAFTGRCRVHRAEIMQLHGEWAKGLEEARRARDRCLEGENPGAAGEACYRRGEIHRLGGELDRAEDAFREASRRGREPQPGLALLRLAQGRSDAAAAAIHRRLAETREPAKRLALLPAAIEIALATGEIAEARSSFGELVESTGSERPAMLEATVAGSGGAIDLAAGDPSSALVGLRRAWELWEELEAPYEAARTRILIGKACDALGDREAAELDFAAAREAFDELGVTAERSRPVGSGPPSPEAEEEGLTGRELEVLRLVAAGRKNREIAEELVISEHTVARHVQNIFAKLDVSSRTAASAYAFEHNLV